MDLILNPDDNSEELTFSERMRRLPGYKAWEEKHGSLRCPRCNDKTKWMRRMAGKRICDECGFVITVDPDGQEQKAALSFVDITNFVFGSWDNCFYCGQLPSCRDHVIPYSMHSPRHTSGSRSGPRCMACQECNTLLSDKYHPTLEIRFFRVQSIIRERNHKLLRIPDWSDAELKGMGHTLRTHIEASRAKRLIVERKLEWQESAGSAKLWLKAQKEALAEYPENKWLHNFLTRQNP